MTLMRAPLFPLLFLLALAPTCRTRLTGTLVFVSNERDGTISVIDAATDRVIRTITVGGRARGLRVGRDNKSVFVALSTRSGQVRKPDDDRIIAIDISSGDVRASYHVGTDPEQFDLSLDGRRLYVSNGGCGHGLRDRPRH